MGLIPEALFLGGAGLPGKQRPPTPTSPLRALHHPQGRLRRGIVHATMPLVFQGILIEDFLAALRGRQGCGAHAEKNEEALRTLVSMDEGAAMLGSALSCHTRARYEKRHTLHNTLFDENAATWLSAAAIPANIRDYEN